MGTTIDQAPLHPDKGAILDALLESFSERVEAINASLTTVAGANSQNLRARLDEAQHLRTVLVRMTAGLPAQAVHDGKTYRAHAVRKRLTASGRSSKSSSYEHRASPLPGQLGG